MLRQITYILIFTFMLSACYKDNNETTKKVVREYPNTIVEGTSINGVIKYADQTLAKVHGLKFAGDDAKSISPYFYFQSENINQYFEVLTFITEEGLTLAYPLSNVANTNNHHNLTIPDEFTKIEENTDQIIPILIEGQESLDLKISEFQKNSQSIEAPDVYFSLLENVSFPGNMKGLNKDQKPMIVIPSTIFYIGWVDQTIEYIDTQASVTSLFALNPENGQWNEVVSRTISHSGFYAYGQQIVATESTVDIVYDFTLEGIETTIQYNDETIMSTIISENNKIATFLPLEEGFQIEVSSGSMELDINDYFLTESEDLTIQLDDQTLDIIRIQVLSKDCNDKDLERSILEIKGDNYTSHHFIESQEIKILNTGTSNLEFKLISPTSEETTLAIVFENSNFIQLGRQYLCEDIGDEYLYFLLDGHKRVLSNITTSFSEPSITIEGSNSIENIEFKLRFDASGVGSLEDTDANIFLDALGLDKGYKLNCFNSEFGCGFESFDISLFKTATNEYVKGTFKGTFWIEAVIEENVGYREMEGEFQVKVQ